MKKTILTLTLISFLLSSCNNKKEENTKEENKQEQVSTEAASHDNHETHQSNDALKSNWMNEMQLDNGNKWTANSETNIGVQKMKDILKTQTTNTLEDYHNVAAELIVAKNYVVKECTMKGSSHDNLHIWLLPLIEKIDMLSESKTTDEASEIKESILKNVEAYSDYFK